MDWPTFEELRTRQQGLNHAIFVKTVGDIEVKVIHLIALVAIKYPNKTIILAQFQISPDWAKEIEKVLRNPWDILIPRIILRSSESYDNIQYLRMCLKRDFKTTVSQITESLLRLSSRPWLTHILSKELPSHTAMNVLQIIREEGKKQKIATNDLINNIVAAVAMQ